LARWPLGPTLSIADMRDPALQCRPQPPTETGGVIRISVMPQTRTVPKLLGFLGNPHMRAATLPCGASNCCTQSQRKQRRLLSSRRCRTASRARSRSLRNLARFPRLTKL
jgi:hypothetical protein